MAYANTLRYDAAVKLLEARKIVEQLREECETWTESDKWKMLAAEIEEIEKEVEPEESARQTWNRYLKVVYEQMKRSHPS